MQPAHFSVFSLLWVVRYGLASLTVLCKACFGFLSWIAGMDKSLWLFKCGFGVIKSYSVLFFFSLLLTSQLGSPSDPDSCKVPVIVMVVVLTLIHLLPEINWNQVWIYISYVERSSWDISKQFEVLWNKKVKTTHRSAYIDE